MNYPEAIAYLTRCADDTGTHWHGGRSYPADECATCNGTNDAGHLAAPCSRYGRTAAHIAPYVYRVARIDGSTNAHNLDWLMGLAVNDSDTPQEILREYAIAQSGADIDAMVDGYLDCQLWAQLDMLNPSCDCDHDEASEACHNYTLDANYGRDDIDPEYVELVREEFAALVTDHPLAVRMYLNARERAGYDRNELFGHDFYLTREHHGAGFWDRGLGELGSYLTDIAHNYGAAADLWDNGNGVLAA